MTDGTNSALYPQMNESQVIGQLADICFNSNRPPVAWQVTPLTGVTDFGFDYLVQLRIDGQIKYPFKVQLKGTKTPELNATGEFFSIDLSASTVRYYANCAEPVLLVLADLSVNPNRPSDCLQYYVWIHEDLKRFNSSKGELPDSQTSVTFRVPKANALTNDTDLTAEVIQQLKIFRAGLAMDAVVERHHPQLDASARTDLLENISKGFAVRNPSFMDAVAEDAITDWPQPKIGTLSWYIAEATRLLKLGKVTDAAISLASARAIENSAPIDIAEMHYIEARIHTFLGESDAAKAAFEKAMEASPGVPKYLSSWAENELRLVYDPDNVVDYSHITEKLVGDDPLIVAVKVRILSASKKFDDALMLAYTLEEKDRWGVVAVAQMMNSQFDEVIAAADQGLAMVPLKDTDKQLLILMRARAKFYLATAYPGRQAPNEIYPISGTPQTNIPLLHEAWADTSQAVELLREAGWPPNTDFVSDLWTSITGVLDKQAETFPLLVEAARVRSSSMELQLALEIVAMQQREYAVALKANARQPEDTTQIFRRINLLYLSKKDGDCVALLTAKLDVMDRSMPVFGSALLLGIQSAERIIQQEKAKQWEELLNSLPNLAEDAAVYLYFKNLQRNIWTPEQALAYLEENYEKLGRGLLIGLNLFHELDSQNVEQSEKIVAIAAELQTQRKFRIESLLHLCQALSTLRKWDDLLELAQNSLAQFPNHDRFRGIEAFALDRLGRSADALVSLRQMIESGVNDSFSINTYLRIVARSGFTNEAIASIESILPQETKPAQKLQCLYLLLDLVQFSTPEDPRCLSIILEIGDLVDQSKEEEEGVFLGKLFHTTLLCPTKIDEAKSEEINRRLKNFQANHPNSKIFGMAKMPDETDASGILEFIKNILGENEERDRFLRLAENQLRTGAIPFPYAFRPKNVLQNVRDLPTLWEIGKRSKFQEAQFHLTMTTADDVQAALSADIKGRVPIFDLISLMVIQDLELLDDLFKVFPRIAIGQATLNELVNLIRPVSGTPYRTRCQELQAWIRGSFERIDQPSAEASGEDSFIGNHWDSGEVKALAASGRYMLYSDDAIFRIFCEIPQSNIPNFCTLDFLAVLEEQGHRTTAEIAKKISLLCSWHVSVSVIGRYLIAIVPPELSAARTVKEGIELLQTSTDFTNLFNSMWDFSKPFKELLGNMGMIAKELFQNPDYKSIHLAAFVAMWHSKIILRTDVKQSPAQVAIIAFLQIAVFDPFFDEVVSQKMINAFGDLIQLIHGERMDDKLEAAAIEELARGAAEEDVARALHGDKSLHDRLGRGFVAGTSLSDRFYGAYSTIRIEIANKK